MAKSFLVARWSFAVLGMVAIAVAAAQDEVVTSWSPLARHRSPALSPSELAAYSEAIRRTAEMTQDPLVNRLAENHGLKVLNLTWEDTGRYKDSSVGPNISDMTIQVGFGQKDATQAPRCMPIIRADNFSDKTCDVDPSDFTLLVGNEKGQPLKRVSLRDFLASPSNYLTDAQDHPLVHGDLPVNYVLPNGSLLAPRDSRVLVSAQACFLPVPRQGLATFNPVLFNYQSMRGGDPHVLTVLATREGTSTSLLNGDRESFSEGSSWGQRLFHNDNGKRASLTGQRMSDFKSTSGQVHSGPGLNMVLVIQIPITDAMKHLDAWGGIGGGFGGGSAAKTESLAPGHSDVESAVIGHGGSEGDFHELDHLWIRRDPRFPVRVTVQFYKATSNGVVSEADMDAVAHDIGQVYSEGDDAGSLVVGGETGRPTEYLGSKVQPAEWWSEFWHGYQEATGRTPEEGIARLRKLLGDDYQSFPVTNLYLRDLLRK